MNIDEYFAPKIIRIEDVFENEYLEIDYIDKISLDGFEADTGYFVLLVKDSDEIDTEDLVKLGFIKVKEDLYYIEKVKLEIDEKYLEKIRNQRSKKISKISEEKLIKNHQYELMEYYEKINALIYEINIWTKLHPDFNTELFQPTIDSINCALKLPNTICLSLDSFISFSIQIYQFLNESFFPEEKKLFGFFAKKRMAWKESNKNDIEKKIKNDIFESDDFYYKVRDFRHFFLHLKKRGLVDTNDICSISTIRRYMMSKIGRITTYKFDYFIMQKEILKDAIKFLLKINSFLLGDHVVNS